MKQQWLDVTRSSPRMNVTLPSGRDYDWIWISQAVNTIILLLVSRRQERRMVYGRTYRNFIPRIGKKSIQRYCHGGILMSTHGIASLRWSISMTRWVIIVSEIWYRDTDCTLFSQSCCIFDFMIYLVTTESWWWIGTEAENIRQRKSCFNRMDGSWAHWDIFIRS